MVRQWIKSVSLCVVIGFSGCASHINKVVPKDQKNMKQIYNEKAGSGNLEMLKQREADIRARPIGGEDYVTDLPPHAAQIQHLFPALPNPELYMYVKPHVVGASGAAVPAYMTRFTMYERAHYAMPNEVVAKVKHPGVVPPEKKPEEKKSSQPKSSGKP